MIRHQVSSSRITGIGYDPATAELEITFKDNRVCRYSGVPEKVFYTFLSVVSKGRFYDGVIRNKFMEKKRW